jgi:hypothetical protein
LQISECVCGQISGGLHHVFDGDRAAHRFGQYVRQTANAVIECAGKTCHHAVYSRYGNIADPDGHVYHFSSLYSRQLKPYRIWIIE